MVGPGRMLSSVFWLRGKPARDKSVYPCILPLLDLVQLNILIGVLLVQKYICLQGYM